MATHTVHVIAHTHWDREWYQPFAQFRYRLVGMIDELLERMEQGSERVRFPHFHLDGQTVVLEDYLEIRPERRETLRRLIAEGRLLIGPWYVQPDETLVSGEALIRNLAIGIEDAEGFGGTMRVGYVPDIFGHVAQLPQILRGFGIDNAFLWRGMVPPPDGRTRTEFSWVSPSGHRVLGIYLSTSGYFTAPQIDAQSGLDQVLGELSRKAETRDLLLMNGADHHHVQFDLPEQLERMADATYELRISTLPAYVAAVRRALEEAGLSPDAEQRGLYAVEGELRETRRNADGLFLLYGTLSSRMPVKLANHEAEVLLQRVVEPLAARARTRIRPRTQTREAPSWIRRLWRTLLKNHAHDSICGCSVDAVEQDMWGRYREVHQLAEMLVADVLAAAEIVPEATPETGAAEGATEGATRAGEPREAATRSGRADDEGSAARRGVPQAAASAFRTEQRLDIPFLLQNAAGVEAGHVAVVELPIPGELPPQPFYRAAAGAPHRFVVRDEGGTLTPVQVLEVAERSSVETSPRSFPDFRVEHVARIAFVPPRSVPPLSALRFALTEAAEGTERPSDGGEPLARMTEDGICLENEALTVRLARDGRIDFEERGSGRAIDNLLYIEDGGDIGDLYNYSPPPTDRVVTTDDAEPERVELVYNGPLLATARVHYELSLPEGLTGDRQARDGRVRSCPLTLELSLLRGSEELRVDLWVENRVHDHRLRAVVHSDVASAVSHAQGSFSVDRRPVRAEPVPVELWREDAANSHPQKGWAAVEEGEHGMAVLSRGLPEYEVLAAEGGVASSADGTGVGAAGGNAIAVTLLRSVDHVHSRDSLTIDRRAWGIPFRVPLAQCEGRHGFSLAVRPYAGDWAGAAVDHAGERFSTGYRAHALPAAAADVRLGQPLLGSVEPEGVILSALKPAEDGDGVIVRLWNNRDVGREARLELAPEVTRLTRCDLAESPLRDGSGEGHVENGVLGSEPSISDTSNTADGYRTTFFSIGPWEIVTLRLELAGE